MSKVLVAQGNDPARAIADAVDELGLAFVDFVKAAKSICIVSNGSREATQVVIDAIAFHSRVPVHVLGVDDLLDVIEASIPRSDGVRMPIRRPRRLIEAEAVIVVAPLLPDVRRRTELAIEQYLFQTWIVPPRSNAARFLHPHDPWLEGDLRNQVLADLYGQKPIALAFLDGSASSGVTLAGFDAIAVDSVAARMRKIDPESIGYLAELSHQGLGTCALSKIDVPLGVIQG